MRRKVAFCSEHFVSMKSLQTMAQTKRELLEQLWEIGNPSGIEPLPRWALPRAGHCPIYQCACPRGLLLLLTASGSIAVTGFVRTGSSARQVSGGGATIASSHASTNAADIELLKAILVGAMWPKVAKIEAPMPAGGKGRGKGGKGGGKGGGGKGKGGRGGGKGGEPEEMKIKIKDDTGVASATLHPSCVAAQPASKGLSPGCLIYGELVKTSCLFIRDLTVVPPVALMLFGGRLSLDPRASLVLIDDGWVRFRVAPEVAALIIRLRNGLEEILERKIRNPQLDFAKEGGAAFMDGIVKLIASEGAGESAGGAAAGLPPSAAPPPPAFEAIGYSALGPGATRNHS